MSSRLRLFLVYGIHLGSRPSKLVRDAFNATGGGEDDQGATMVIVETAKGAEHYVLQATASAVRLLDMNENPTRPIVSVPDGADPVHVAYVEALRAFCGRHKLPFHIHTLEWLVTAEHG